MSDKIVQLYTDQSMNQKEFYAESFDSVINTQTPDVQSLNDYIKYVGLFELCSKPINLEDSSLSDDKIDKLDFSLRVLAGQTIRMVWKDREGHYHVDTNSGYYGFYNKDNYREACEEIVCLNISSLSNTQRLVGNKWTKSYIDHIYPYLLATNKTTSMIMTFDSASSTLEDPIYVKDWDTSNVVNMYGIFGGCNFNEIDLSRWDVRKVVQFSQSSFATFGTIKKIIGLENWQTNSLTTMHDFANGACFEGVEGIYNWNVSKVASFYNAFRASKFKELLLQNWDTSSATSMGCMFSLSQIETLGLFSIPLNCNTESMFYSCPGLTTIIMKDDAKISASLSFSNCPLTRDSALVIINHLDSTFAGTIQFSATTNTSLTDSDRQIIINKGWTLA